MNDILLSEIEAKMITNATVAVSQLDGDIVEVGVYRGGSAKLICESKGNKNLHLFDTWCGIVSTSPEDLKTHSRFNIGRYSADIKEVEEKLKSFENVHFYQGEFPKTYKDNIKNISLLHIDVDLYQPTKDALEIFWDKIQIGGICILHDYPSFEGVRIAVDNFLSDKKFIKLQITSEQAIIIKQ